MRRKEEARTGQRLAALTVLALVLFNFPMLGTLPSAQASPAAAWAYLFALWAGVIALAAFILHRNGQ